MRKPYLQLYLTISKIQLNDNLLRQFIFADISSITINQSIYIARLACLVRELVSIIGDDISSNLIYTYFYYVKDNSSKTTRLIELDYLFSINRNCKIDFINSYYINYKNYSTDLITNYVKALRYTNKALAKKVVNNIKLGIV